MQNRQYFREISSKDILVRFYITSELLPLHSHIKYFTIGHTLSYYFFSPLFSIEQMSSASVFKCINTLTHFSSKSYCIFIYGIFQRQYFLNVNLYQIFFFHPWYHKNIISKRLSPWYYKPILSLHYIIISNSILLL